MVPLKKSRCGTAEVITLLKIQPAHTEADIEAYRYRSGRDKTIGHKRLAHTYTHTLTRAHIDLLDRLDNFDRRR